MKKLFIVSAIICSLQLFGKTDWGGAACYAQGMWTPKSDFGGNATIQAVGFSIGTKGYIGTGSPNTGPTKAFWEWDQSTDTWTQRADYGGTARTVATGFSIGTKGYIGTGFDNSSDGFRKDFWEWDQSSNTWTQKADFGGSARAYAIGFSIGNKGYIGTGEEIPDFLETKDFWEWDQSTDTWTQKADFGPGVRALAVGFSIGTKGYIGTGNDGVITYKDFWEWDQSSDAWTQKSDFGGTQRLFAVGFATGTKGYIGTGSYTEPYKDFWEWNQSTDTWIQMADFGGSARNYAVGFSIGDKGYIGCGLEDYTFAKRDFWEFDPVCSGFTVYADTDSDSYGDAANSFFAADCIIPPGYVYNTTDCNDTNASVYPGAPETCNTMDDNCNGFIDEGCGNTITTGSISGSPFCPEAAVNVPFTSSGLFSSGNVYTAELSDKRGNFTAPVAIGTLSSSANAGTIAGIIPSDPKGGQRFRIRVTSSAPVVIGTDNGANLVLLGCNKVSGLSASGVTSSGATLNWSGVPCAVKYRIQYRRQGLVTWTVKGSTTNSYSITGLVANAVYEYRVRTFCTANRSSISGFTAIQTFTTTLRLASGSASAEGTMSLYPNPFSSSSIITFSLADDSRVQIQLNDIAGRKVQTVLDENLAAENHSVTLNRNQLIPGIYFLQIKISSAEGLAGMPGQVEWITKKVVIE